MSKGQAVYSAWVDFAGTKFTNLILLKKFLTQVDKFYPVRLANVRGLYSAKGQKSFQKLAGSGQARFNIALEKRGRYLNPRPNSMIVTMNFFSPKQMKSARRKSKRDKSKMPSKTKTMLS